MSAHFSEADFLWDQELEEWEAHLRRIEDERDGDRLDRERAAEPTYGWYVNG